MSERFIRQSPDCGKALLDSSSCQAQRFEVKAKSQDNGPVQRKSRLGTIPGDELLHCELIVSPGMGRTEAAEYRGFRVIKIWELQNDLAAGWPSVPSAHMSGLPC